MKTIGLVTYYQSDNFGAMLQAYALEQAIGKCGCRCLIISHDRFSVKTRELAGERYGKAGKVVRALTTAVRYPRSLFMLGAAQTKQIRLGKQAQRAKCASFRDASFPDRTKVFYYTSEQIQKDPPVCDGYVCGSDQIWSPERLEGAGPFFLDFAPAGRNRIAYAPSLAMTYIPDAMKGIYRDYLSRFSDVSVREEKGCTAVEEATGRRPAWVMDPVFLLGGEAWEAFSAGVAGVPERYILCYFLGKENLLRSRRAINRLAGEKQAKVIVLPFGEHKADRTWLSFPDAGPREFVGLIRNAQYVVTDSFHGTSLSIVLHKDFSVYSGTQTATFANRFDRIANVLRVCGLEERTFAGGNGLSSVPVDYSRTDAALNPMIDASRRFLKQALEKVEEKGKAAHEAPVLAPDEACTGCSACFASCPEHAVAMRKDRAGFWRPVIDREKCVHCGICEKHCPVITPARRGEEAPAYRAVYARDSAFRKKGSSGNAFGLFAQKILSAEGEVFGAALSEDCRSLRMEAASVAGMDRLQKSKYFEAGMGEVIQAVRTALDAGKPVMFTGTPCQAAGVRKCLGDRENLLICDFVCHGVPSAEWFGRYLTAMEQRYGAKATDVGFRSKAFGWRLYCMKITFANGREYLKTRYADPYFIDFFKNRHLRTSCYSCSWVPESCADVTFGDYWAVREKKNMEDHDEGVSLVCLRTEKGKRFFEELAGDTDAVFVQALRADEAQGSLVSRLRKPAPGHDVLPERFDMRPRLDAADLLRRIYYEKIVKKYE